MLSVIMQSVIMQNVIMLSVIMLGVSNKPIMQCLYAVCRFAGYRSDLCGNSQKALQKFFKGLPWILTNKTL